MDDRAYMAGGRQGDGLARVRDEVARILGGFLGAGAIEVEPAALMPADVLLDLYGEDIRARAYLTGEHGAEQMLRPDFTVPVARAHMDGAVEPARYAYAGPVWRRQPRVADRAQEYLQVGVEFFGDADAAEADAAVFALVSAAVEGQELGVSTGDIGLLFAAIDGLKTSDWRKAALRRHVWRPQRFQRLVEMFSAPRDGKDALLAVVTARGATELVAEAGPEIGVRRASEVVERLERLVLDRALPPLGTGEREILSELAGLNASMGHALERLSELAREMPALMDAVGSFAARAEALERRGVKTDALPFEGAYGRTTLEYYDGFVFGFRALDRPDLPLVASGGRYDALTSVLGRGAGVPAVGGIVRPEVLLALGDAI